jgi:hypothetical protein
VAVDGQGNVYIADLGNQRVRKVSRGGTITTIAGTGKYGFSGDGGPATSARLYNPYGVAVDGKGNVYIADHLNSRVRKVSTRAAPVISGRCSKATALRVATQFQLGVDPTLPNPIAQVLCGAFVGTGSQAMAVSVAIPSCGRTAQWAVFRWAGGAWQRVMTRNNGADLDAVGSDIRETQFVLLPTDSHCFPTGGTRSRTWHWNGSRFVTGPWKVTPGTAAKPAVGAKSAQFRTPSGNIVCQYLPASEAFPRAFLECVIKSKLRPAPPRRSCQEGGYAGDRVNLYATGRVSVPSCAGDYGAYLYVDVARVLGYGKTWSAGGFSCTSAITGLTCRNKSGHGFFLSREHWRAF